ncbi:hypothetical protein [Benzoatithermus flavus]|uniref:Uncharacterized protein n=1 Tax=Benzoatithermus flavus TaxID=3108223 RepID=A0ABU8Y064_9PROT
MRALLLTTALATALVLPGLAGAQQSLPTEPPPNPQKVVPDQRLENVNQRLLTASEQLHKAAEDRDKDHAARALDYAYDTVQEVRSVFAGLPQDQRAPYDQAFAEAERTLKTKDPAASAEALKQLRERVLDLVAGKG